MARTKKDEVLYIRVTKEVKDILQSAADFSDVSMNDLVNAIIKEYLKTQGVE